MEKVGVLASCKCGGPPKEEGPGVWYGARVGVVELAAPDGPGNDAPRAQ
jgi:hypothetical protein